MKEIPDNIKDIIIDYLQSKAGEQAIKTLGDWRNESVENDKALKLFTTTWQQASEALQAQTFDAATAWEAVSRRVIVSEDEMVQNTPAIKTGSRIAHFKKWAIAAAVLSLVFLIGKKLLFKSNSELHTIEALVQNQEIVLPDSSHVILRKGATLQYPTIFGSNERRISLKGEAFFTVEHDARHPFRIQTDQSLIEVKGTSFLVHASSNVDHVVVASGSVLFSSRADTSVRCLLSPKQKAVFDGKQFATITVQDSNYLSWYTRELKFAGKNLSAVAMELADYYKVGITLSDSLLGNIRITGTFHEQPLSQVLDEISILTGLQYKQVDTAYLLYNK